LGAGAVTSAGSSGELDGTIVALNLFYSATHDDYALTTWSANSTGPDGTYTFMSQEGSCFASAVPPLSAPPTTTPGAASIATSDVWAATNLSLWFNKERNDFQTCGTVQCLSDVHVLGYEVVDPFLCSAWNVTGPENLPCNLAGHSIQRSDPAWGDNSYWRGRIWGPHYQLLWWGLERYDHVPEVRAVRLELVNYGVELARNVWSVFRQVPENVNGVFGFPEDVPNADPFYTWGALFGFVGLLEAGLY
jgi:hypothetical protein